LGRGRRLAEKFFFYFRPKRRSPGGSSKAKSLLLPPAENAGGFRRGMTQGGKKKIPLFFFPLLLSPVCFLWLGEGGFSCFSIRNEKKKKGGNSKGGGGRNPRPGAFGKIPGGARPAIFGWGEIEKKKKNFRGRPGAATPKRLSFPLSPPAEKRVNQFFKTQWGRAALVPLGRRKFFFASKKPFPAFLHPRGGGRCLPFPGLQFFFCETGTPMIKRGRGGDGSAASFQPGFSGGGGGGPAGPKTRGSGSKNPFFSRPPVGRKARAKRVFFPGGGTGNCLGGGGGRGGRF